MAVKGFHIWRSLALVLIWALLLVVFPARPASAVRLKEIASVEGVRDNPLIGYGLVVGLQGTGDKDNTKFTTQSLTNMLLRLGVKVSPQQIKVKNVAAVVATAKLPPFSRPGQRLDVMVSSLGDAKSLQGGTLLMTPLRGPDGKVYAVAQGPISVGGFVFAGAGGRIQQNHPTVGVIPNGAVVEREVPVLLELKETLKFILHRADFTTAKRAAEALNSRFGSGTARCLDSRTLLVRVPKQYRFRVSEFLAESEALEIRPDSWGHVVVDERTGTIIMGERVRIDPVAIAQGGLTVIIKERPEVSQPQPFAPGAPAGATAPQQAQKGVRMAPGGQTVVVPRTEMQVEEKKEGMVVLKGGVSISELVQALNAIGVTPRQLISILRAIHKAGALHATLEVI
jgi:flagellar P-ring protein precursor FlgI